jgi:hypothetical protein
VIVPAASVPRSGHAIGFQQGRPARSKESACIPRSDAPLHQPSCRRVPRGIGCNPASFDAFHPASRPDRPGYHLRLRICLQTRPTLQ